MPKVKVKQKPAAPAIDRHPAFRNLDGYLNTFAPAMAQRVHDGFEPLYDPESDSLSPEVLGMKSCADGKMAPLPAQAVAVEGILRSWREIDAAWLIGELGTGKTPISLWAVRAWSERLGRPIRMVISAPNQLVRKWKRHVELIMPDADVRIVGSWKELTRIARHSVRRDKFIPAPGSDGGSSPVRQQIYRRTMPKRHEVFILARDRGKLGYNWRNSAIRKERIVRIEEGSGKIVKFRDHYYACPTCFTALRDAKGVPLTEVELGRRVKHVCQHCAKKRGERGNGDGAVWQAFSGFIPRMAPPEIPVPKVAPRRMAPCALLRKIGMRFDFYICDEAHEERGANTLQGQLLQDLALISDRQLLLTGTLSGGYADNILHLLWRTAPHRMVEDGLKHSDNGHEDFVALYGVLQTEKRYSMDSGGRAEDLSLGRGKLRSTRTKSMPGISPVLFVNFLLDRCVFIRLQEMHAHLPAFTERVHSIRLDRDQDEVLAQMQYEFESHKRLYPRTKAHSAARATFLRWPDKPFVEPYDVMHYDEASGQVALAFQVPKLESKERPKERRVRRLVQRNMLRGRKTWVFTELTGRGATDKPGDRQNKPRWDWMDYLAEYLAKHGIRAAVLRTESDGGPNPVDREDWIAKHTPDVDVIISNPSLVQTGLDLFDFPSIVFAFTGYSTYVLRQASRRAWRLGQTHDCEVDYLIYATPSGGYSKSIQDAALSLVARKMESSLSLEGEFSSEGLSALAGGEDVASQLAKFIDGRLDTIEPAAAAFARYRQKLEETMPDLAKVRGFDRLPAPPAESDAPPAAQIEETIRSLEAVLAPTVMTLPIPPAPAPPAQTAAAFERPSIIGAREPDSIRQKRALRLAALSATVGTPDLSDGDWHRIKGRWYQLVAKHRSTVRDRNFDLMADVHKGTGMIAFVEPDSEAGPSTSTAHVEVSGIKYLVSVIPAAEYLAGKKVPGNP